MFFNDADTRFVGENVIFECLLSEEQLAGGEGVVWSRFPMMGDPLPEGRFNTTCPLNQTLILQNLMLPNDAGTYVCQLGGGILDFFSLQLLCEL